MPKYKRKPSLKAAAHRKQLAESWKFTTEKFIELSRLVHGDKYDYSNSVYTGAHKKIEVICPKHGSFFPVSSEHYRHHTITTKYGTYRRATGCRFCTADNKRYEEEEFIVAAKKVHEDKYDYSQTKFIDTSHDIRIICPTHGPFTQNAGSHLQGRGCTGCKVQKTVDRCSMTQDEFLKRAIEVHGDVYDYSNVVYEYGRKKVIITCKIHGKFLQGASDHLSGRGCKKCGILSRAELSRMTLEEFLKKANQLYGDTYDYSNVSLISTRDKVEILCKKHGLFLQRPYQHLNISSPNGCPKCNWSLGERKIARWLDVNQIPYIYQKRFDDFRGKMGMKFAFDFFIPSLKLLIEYDGVQHFLYGIRFGHGGYTTTFADLENTRRKDLLKNTYADSKGLRLLRIPYTQFRIVEEILQKEIPTKMAGIL